MKLNGFNINTGHVITIMTVLIAGLGNYFFLQARVNENRVDIEQKANVSEVNLNFKYIKEELKNIKTEQIWLRDYLIGHTNK